jgi:hypothetical protein
MKLVAGVLTHPVGGAKGRMVRPKALGDSRGTARACDRSLRPGEGRRRSCYGRDLCNREPRESGVTERLNGFQRELEDALEAVRRRYFWIHLTVDFLAGISFVVGSVFFFYPSLVYAGTWLFLVGSILFAAKPSVRLAHELKRGRVSKSMKQSAPPAGPNR